MNRRQRRRYLRQQVREHNLALREWGEIMEKREARAARKARKALRNPPAGLAG